MADNGQPQVALIIADGDVPPIEQLAPILAGLPSEQLLVIAADGGLHKAELLGLRPTLVIGDGDSIGAAKLAELAGSGTELQLHPRDKDESDTELALREAIRRGARRVVIVGALGGIRFDHELANLLLLGLPELAGREVVLVDGRTSVRVLSVDAGALELTGTANDIVSLLPLTEQVTGVRTSGLRFPLDTATLTQGPTRGLSNELTGPRCRIEISGGRLAVIHTALHGGAA